MNNLLKLFEKESFWASTFAFIGAFIALLVTQSPCGSIAIG